MTRANNDIRVAAKKAGVPLWKIAKRLGIVDATFSRWLRDEFPPERKREILAIIDEISKEVA